MQKPPMLKLPNDGKTHDNSYDDSWQAGAADKAIVVAALHRTTTRDIQAISRRRHLFYCGFDDGTHGQCEHDAIAHAGNYRASGFIAGWRRLCDGDDRTTEIADRPHYSILQKRVEAKPRCHLCLAWTLEPISIGTS